ncbi:hypothetical protein MRX96_034511 [Rhipicephalus microplus]
MLGTAPDVSDAQSSLKTHVDAFGIKQCVSKWSPQTRLFCTGDQSWHSSRLQARTNSIHFCRRGSSRVSPYNDALDPDLDGQKKTAEKDFGIVACHCNPRSTG